VKATTEINRWRIADRPATARFPAATVTVLLNENDRGKKFLSIVLDREGVDNVRAGRVFLNFNARELPLLVTALVEAQNELSQ